MSADTSQGARGDSSWHQMAPDGTKPVRCGVVPTRLIRASALPVNVRHRRRERDHDQPGTPSSPVVVTPPAVPTIVATPVDGARDGCPVTCR
ncbi:hypothetical protein [Streptomyces achromogenes]|nr:hypothetical protein [Streptomyces achromogenes]